jgi:hypothetical protein
MSLMIARSASPLREIVEEYSRCSGVELGLAEQARSSR